jgi:hypothetical protein
MKQQAPRVVVPPHPGPMRFNRSDPGYHGILIAIGFAVLGMIGLPLYRLFFVGTVCLGAVVACLLYFVRKSSKNPSGLFPLDLSSEQSTTSEKGDSVDRLPDSHPRIDQRMLVVVPTVAV